MRIVISALPLYGRHWHHDEDKETAALVAQMETFKPDSKTGPVFSSIAWSVIVAGLTLVVIFHRLIAVLLAELLLFLMAMSVAH